MSASLQPPLSELQRWFASVTTNPSGVVDEQVERLVSAGPQLSARDRVRIYNDGYFARLLECLADDYPALAYAVGDETFERLARAYIEQHPSRSRSLNAYGEHFAELCRSRPEPWGPFAADLARLEWALVEVVHAPISPSMAASTLATIPPDGWQSARLLPNDGVRLLRFEHAVNEFYQSFRDDEEPSISTPRETATAVYRQGLSLWRLGLEPRAALLLGDLLAGVPLGVAIAALERRSPTTDLAQLLPQWLGAWVQSGFFRGVELT